MRFDAPPSGAVFWFAGGLNEIRHGERQDAPPAIFLCAVPRVNRGELPARNCDAALLLQSRLLRRSQGARPSTPKSCEGVIIGPVPVSSVLPG
jgi:hypothetical protein